MTRTKGQRHTDNAVYLKTHTTIGVTNEVIELMDKVKAIQYQRLGIGLKRSQILVLVLKDHITRTEHEASTN